MKVLVVGLNPSKRNGDPPSLIRLYKWLDHLNIKHVSFINLYEDYEPDYKERKSEYIKCISGGYDRILALGNTVSECLTDMDVDHHRLPHPSGLNRKLNDKKFVDEQLQICKNYIWGNT